MRSAALLPLVLLCAAAAGCDTGDGEEGPHQAVPITLARLLTDRGEVTVDVDIVAGHVGLDYGMGSGCITLGPDAGATVNGEPMTLLEPGSGYVSDEPPVNECQRPAWSFERRDAGEASTTFTLSDGTATLVAAFANLDADRTLNNPDASVADDGTLGFGWLPASDQLENLGAYLETPDGNTRYDDLPLENGGSPGVLLFRPLVNYTGAATLHVSGTLEAGVLQCTPSPLMCKATAPFGPGDFFAPTLPVELTAKP